MLTTIRRALVAMTGTLLLLAGVMPAQAASDRGEQARSEHQRIVDFWTPARVAQAVPRDPVFDDRGLPYLRASDGSLKPFGHGTSARVQASVPAWAATAPDSAAGPSATDSAGPSIDGMDPAAAATIGSAYGFRATVVDNADGVKAVSFVLTHPDGSTQANSATYLGNDLWGIDYSGFWDGDWEWQVVAKDGARRGGNTTSTPWVAFRVNTGSGGSSGGGSGGGGGTAQAELGASWTGGGAVQATTGKVLFAIGTSYYVCSASVVPDPGFDNDHSYILTAAHCVYDGGGGGRFASNWMFIPDYDTLPVGLTTSGSFCPSTQYGCWTADALVIDSGFASQRRFTSTATRHDYAVVRVGAGGNGDVQLDSAVGTQAVSFAEGTFDGNSNPDTHLFGYPAASPYDGKDLVYSFGDLGLDPLNNSLTYRVASDMTGGCSGGPWFQGFTAGVGTQMSVNSYGYQGVTALHGPIFNSNTEAVHTAAKNATGNTIVQVS